VNVARTSPALTRGPPSWADTGGEAPEQGPTNVLSSSPKLRAVDDSTPTSDVKIPGPRPFARRTLARRLTAGYILGLVAVLAVLTVPLDRRLEASLLDDLTSSLTTTAKAVRSALPPDDGLLQAAVVPLAREVGVRVTVIRPDGVVLADSEHAPTTMENHSERPEVRAAQRGRIGVSSRTSETVGRPFRYVALSQRDGRIVRVALSQDIIGSRLARTRSLIAVGAAVALLVGTLAAWLISRHVARPLAHMTSAASAIAAGNLDIHIPEEGTAELIQLAATLNRMASDLRARIDEVNEDRRTRDVVLAAMDEGVMLIGADGVVQYANPSALRLTGRMAAELRGGDVEADRPYVPQAVRELIDDARKTGTVREREIELGRPTRTVLASAFPVGSEGLALLVLRDVTEARRVEEIRRDFVGAASHELKTPVASIQAAAETLSHALDEDPEAARRFVAHLIRDSERLSMIVRDLLDLSRLETERIEFEPVRLDELAREEVERVGERLLEAGLVVEFDATPVNVRGADEDLSLMIGNLLDNAMRYTRPGGVLRVEVEATNGTARLKVSDTGIGIPSKDLPRIFERFYRVDRARSRDTGGTGLGLAIVKHVAEQHGGRVEAQSELGSGSTFIVTLPGSP
jgi:two-component system, OmpR family, phosphate regulon sensor histidine kinase PhoR